VQYVLLFIFYCVMIVVCVLIIIILFYLTPRKGRRGFVCVDVDGVTPCCVSRNTKNSIEVCNTTG
jgi:uncharacterized membrane protein YqiK